MIPIDFEIFCAITLKSFLFFKRGFILVGLELRAVLFCYKYNNTILAVKRLPRTDTAVEVWFLNQSKGWQEAQTDAAEDGVGELSAGALDDRGLVVLDEDERRDNCENDS